MDEEGNNVSGKSSRGDTVIDIFDNDELDMDIDCIPESPPLLSGADQVDNNNDKDEEDSPKAGEVIVDTDFHPTKKLDEDDACCDDEEDDQALLAQVEALERSLVVDDNFVNTAYNNSTFHLDEAEEQGRITEISSWPRLSPSQRIFPDLRSSNFHTVAFKLKPDYVWGNVFEAHPSTFVSRWEPGFVPMPCAPENIRTFKVRQQQQPLQQEDKSDQITGANGTVSSSFTSPSPRFVEKRVWLWERIESALSVPLHSVEDVTTALRRYHRSIPNSNKSLPVLVHTLDTLMTPDERNVFLEKTLPVIQTLATDVGRYVTAPLPLLTRHANYSLSLSQLQVAALLASAFFATFPPRRAVQCQSADAEGEFPSINFTELFGCPEEDETRLKVKSHKLRCILNYFDRIAKEMPRGVVTYTRRSLKPSKSYPWADSNKGLTPMVPLLRGTIEEEGAGMLQVDFANKLVGGGVLGGGAVQEEILFVLYPELLLARLFTQKLGPTEALIVTGCERFSRGSGYSRSFRFDGDFIDTTPVDGKGRRCTQFVAIDALYVTKPLMQFHPKQLARELNKAYAGFSSPSSGPSSSSSIPVASGKWGCGAFGGDPTLKAILQWLACSAAGRPLAFFTFGDSPLHTNLLELNSLLRDKTIREIWVLLVQYNSLFCSTSAPTGPKLSLYEFLVKYASLGSSSDKEEDPSSTSTLKMKEVPITHFYSSPRDALPAEVTSTSSLEQTQQNKDDPGSTTTAKNKVFQPETKTFGNGDTVSVLGEEDIKALLEEGEDSKEPQPCPPKEDAEIEEEVGCPSAPKKRTTLTDFYAYTYTPAPKKDFSESPSLPLEQ